MNNDLYYKNGKQKKKYMLCESKEKIAELKKEGVRLMKIKNTSGGAYTKDQVRDLVADVLSDLVIELKDPSLVIAGMLVMQLLDKKLK